MTDEQMHALMAVEIAKQGQALADDKRRENHFQCRLSPELAKQLRHFMASRDINANQALNTIISQFFGSSKC
ncbi:MAG: hypothetical protein ACO28M_11085 [Vulcanococcus sp.]|jgi:hypothetical protein